MKLQGLVIMLAVAACSHLVAADDDFAAQLVSKLLTLPSDTLALTQPVVPAVDTCSLSAQLQSGDTCSSLAAKYGVNPSLMVTLNNGLDCSRSLTSGKSICIGGANAACNNPLNSNQQCPDSFKQQVTDTRGQSLRSPLLAVLTGQPDLYKLYQDPQTSVMVVRILGKDSLVMTVPGITDAVSQIRANPGHPFVELWAASGANTPMVISIIPARFSDGGALITYVPGSSMASGQLDVYPLVRSVWSTLSGLLGGSTTDVQQSGGRKLLAARTLLQSNSPPAGSAYYQSPTWYG